MSRKKLDTQAFTAFGYDLEKIRSFISKLENESTIDDLDAFFSHVFNMDRIRDYCKYKPVEDQIIFLNQLFIFVKELEKYNFGNTSFFRSEIAVDKFRNEYRVGLASNFTCELEAAILKLCNLLPQKRLKEINVMPERFFHDENLDFEDNDLDEVNYECSYERFQWPTSINDLKNIFENAITNGHLREDFERVKDDWITFHFQRNLPVKPEIALMKIVWYGQLRDLINLALLIKETMEVDEIDLKKWILQNFKIKKIKSGISDVNANVLHVSWSNISAERIRQNKNT